MAVQTNKAARIKVPFDVGSNDYDVVKFTAETTHKANAIPAAWCGQYVKIYVTGGILHYGFSTNSSAEVDSSVAATDAGASAKVGEPIPDGESVHVEVPAKDTSDTMYFVREASASCTVYMRRA